MTYEERDMWDEADIAYQQWKDDRAEAGEFDRPSTEAEDDATLEEYRARRAQMVAAVESVVETIRRIQSAEERTLRDIAAFEEVAER